MTKQRRDKTILRANVLGIPIQVIARRVEQSQTAAAERHGINRRGAADIAAKCQRGAVRRPGRKNAETVQVRQLGDPGAISVSQEYLIIINCRGGPVAVSAHYCHGPRVGDVSAIRAELRTEIGSQNIVESERGKFCSGGDIEDFDQVRGVAVIVPIDGDLSSIGRPTGIKPGTGTKEDRHASRPGGGIDGNQVEAIVGSLKYKVRPVRRPIRTTTARRTDRKTLASARFPLALHHPESLASPKGDVSLSR